MQFKCPVVTSNPLIMCVSIRCTSDSYLPGKELHCDFIFHRKQWKKAFTKKAVDSILRIKIA